MQNVGVKREEGICSKRAYYQELTAEAKLWRKATMHYITVQSSICMETNTIHWHYSTSYLQFKNRIMKTSYFTQSSTFWPLILQFPTLSSPNYTFSVVNSTLKSTCWESSHETKPEAAMTVCRVGLNSCGVSMMSISHSGSSMRRSGVVGKPK